MRSRSARQLFRERAAAETAVVDYASTLSVEIARRLLARFRQRDLLTTFLDELGVEPQQVVLG
jgi:hypothetical protein